MTRRGVRIGPEKRDEEGFDPEKRDEEGFDGPVLARAVVDDAE